MLLIIRKKQPVKLWAKITKHPEWEKGGKEIDVCWRDRWKDSERERHGNGATHKCKDSLCGGVLSLIFFLTLFSWAEGALSKHNVDCSCASQEMPQLQITDQAKHVWRGALRGINSPPFPPSALTPATTFITGRENIVSCPLTNTCQFQEKELLFSATEGK